MTPNPFNLRRADLIHNVCLLAHGILARYPAGKLDPADREIIAREALGLHYQIVAEIERENSLIEPAREQAPAAFQKMGGSGVELQQRAQAQETRWTQTQPDPDSEVKAPARPSQSLSPSGISFPKESQSPEDLSASTTWPGHIPGNPS